MTAGPAPEPSRGRAVGAGSGRAYLARRPGGTRRPPEGTRRPDRDAVVLSRPTPPGPARPAAGAIGNACPGRGRPAPRVRPPARGRTRRRRPAPMRSGQVRRPCLLTAEGAPTSLVRRDGLYAERTPRRAPKWSTFRLPRGSPGEVRPTVVKRPFHPLGAPP